MDGTLAIVVPELLPVPPVRGGAVEHWVQAFSTGLAARGRRLVIVSRPAGDGAAAVAGIRYAAIPWTRAELAMQRLKDRVSWRNPLRYVAKAQNVWSYGRRVDAAVDGAAAVYLHNEPNVLLLLPARDGRRVVLHMHNDHLSSRLFEPLYRRALARADAVLCVSEFIRARAAARYPEHAHRFDVVLNATDAELFKPYGEAAWQALAGVLPRLDDSPTLLYAGRLVPIKGVHVLIDAFRRLRERLPRARLVIAGSSFFEGAAATPYERELRRLAAPVRDSIVFTGYLPHATLKYLYSAADVVVVPSVWDEPSGLVVLEAMAAGTAVVATAVGGIPESVDHGETGMLVAPRDSVALAETISRLLADPTRKRDIEAAARERVLARFTWPRLIDEVEQRLA